MKWVKHDSEAIKSEDGRYSVCRIGGKDGFFEAWRTRQHPDGPCLVSTNLKTANEARRMALEDSRGEDA